MMIRILIVDDEKFFRKVITGLLSKSGYDVTAAQSAEEALEILENESFDLMISDVNMLPMNGLTLLEKTQKAFPDMGVIMLTGHDDVDLALYAMKKGAFDFLVKPFQLQDLLATVLRSLEYYHAVPKSEPLKARVGSLEELLVQSESTDKIVNLIRRVAPTTVTVLLSAENGSNKTLFARTLHYYSDRKDFPFFALNCAETPAEQIAEELFGDASNKPGLLETARGGTVFINNINCMPLDIQAELLRILQEQRFMRKKDEALVDVDVRIVVGSNQDLEDLVKRGEFLEPLYCRLSVLCISIPALRDRPNDIVPLAYQVLRQAVEGEADPPEISSEAQDILYNYDWPANVRELKEVLSHALSLATDGVITEDLLPEKLVKAAESRKTTAGAPAPRENLRGLSFRELLQKKIKSMSAPPDSADAAGNLSNSGKQPVPGKSAKFDPDNPDSFAGS